MELKTALEIANKLVETLSPHCTLINIAGSCRREKPEVKDIEIVALPKYIQIPSEPQGLFDDIPPAMKTVISPGYLKVYNEIGKKIKGKAVGKYSQFELSEGIKLDLFTPDDFDYYRIFAIRTGSADYSARVIAQGWLKVGWCGSDKGLRKISECEKKFSSEGVESWKCINPNGELPPVWESEEEFFEWLKVKWIEPCRRDM